MLVLTRKQDEVINIGPDIKVQVVSIRGDKVRLGIVAPASVVVNRLEVAERVAKIEKWRAGKAGGA